MSDDGGAGTIPGAYQSVRGRATRSEVGGQSKARVGQIGRESGLGQGYNVTARSAEESSS